MLQSKARLLELNAKLADTLTSKGVTATADETTTALVNKVAYITSGDDSVLRGLIQRDLTEIVIPYGVTSIGADAFYNFSSLTSATIPDSVTSIGNTAFQSCKSLTSITIPDSVTSIGAWAFARLTLLKNIKLSSNANVSEAMLTSCNNIEEIYVPEGVTTIKRYAFNDCTSLKTVYLPSTITDIGVMPKWFKIFDNDTNLEFVTLGNGFNANNLDLSASTLYSRETILQWLNALADRTGQTAYKLTIGATNLAKLTEQDILIATNKNWTLA